MFEKNIVAFSCSISHFVVVGFLFVCLCMCECVCVCTCACVYVFWLPLHTLVTYNDCMILVQQSNAWFQRKRTATQVEQMSAEMKGETSLVLPAPRRKRKRKVRAQKPHWVILPSQPAAVSCRFAETWHQQNMLWIKSTNEGIDEPPERCRMNTTAKTWVTYQNSHLACE